MRSEIEGLVRRADPSAGLSFYYELDDTFYSATSKTFIGQLFELLGLENIADPVGKGSGGYPQLSAEYILEADPDLIFLADTKCCGQSPETVAERPGWDELSAVDPAGSCRSTTTSPRGGGQGSSICSARSRRRRRPRRPTAA